MAIEGAMAVAELAWWRMDRRSEMRGAAAAREKELAAAEAALVIQREDNRRLRATLDEYNGVLRELQEKAEGVEWLGKELSTAKGTADFFQRLQDRIDSPEFVEKLNRPPELTGEPSETARFSTKDGYEVVVDVEDPDWWLWVTPNDVSPIPNEPFDLLDGSGYVVVESEDVIDGIASFIARFLAAHPETKNMTPSELQEGMSAALAEIRTKNTFSRLWKWGKFFYTTGSWATTVLSVCKNPIIVRGIMIGLWTSSRIILRFIK